MPAPKPGAAKAIDASNLVAQTPAVVIAPPPGAAMAPVAAATPAGQVTNTAKTAEVEVPLYNLSIEEIQKHPKWGPVLQQLSQSCVAFYAAQKRVPGSVDELKSKGFMKEFPAAPDGMMYQIDAANYRVLLVSM